MLTLWRDLHQIVDLGALADDGVADRAAVDRGVGADLDVVLDDDAADLRHLRDARAAPGTIAEAVLADARAGMDDDAVADQRMHQRGAGADRAVAADAHAGPDHGVRRRSRVPAPISAPGPITAPGSTRDARSPAAPTAWTRAPGATPVRFEQRGRPQRLRERARARRMTKAR